MTRTALAATSAIVALLGIRAALAGPVPVVAVSAPGPAPPPVANPNVHTLYSQNSDDAGVGIVSQNFTSNFTDYVAEAADDFVVPRGQRWSIGEIDVTGAYFNGSGPAQSVNVTFWKDSSGMPGVAVKGGTYRKLHCRGMKTGSFSCRLPRRLKLGSDRYWVTVQANCSSTCGEWGWELHSTIINAPATWRCERYCGVCPTWDTLYDCAGYDDDLMFALKT